jgi:HEPN domain-containing protein
MRKVPEYSLLNVVEEVLQELGRPAGPSEIVRCAGDRIKRATKSEYPDVVVSELIRRDLRRYGEASKFRHVARGLYDLRDRKK